MRGYNEQAKHNLDTQAILNKVEGHEDWEITAVYYTALMFCKHYAKQKDKKEFGTHEEAAEYLRQNKPEIHKAFRRLLNKSYLARYTPEKAENMDKQTVNSKIEDLKEIRKSLSL